MMLKNYINFLAILLVPGILLSCEQTPRSSAQTLEQFIQRSLNPPTLVHLITENTEREITFNDGATGRVQRPNGELGSGFFVDRDKIVTNIHCVAGETKIRAKLVGTKRFYDIEGVVASDPENDLVILKIAGKGPKPLPLGAVEIGKSIASVSKSQGGESKITRGKMHSRRVSDGWLRLTANLQPGDSGSPVLSSEGVIGIVVQNASGSYSSFSYAVPSNTLEQLLENSGAMEDLAQWQKKKAIRAYTHHGVAQELFENGKSNPQNQQLFYQTAIKFLDKAIKLYPSCSSFRLLGDIYAELKQYQNAIDAYDECINLKKDFALVYYCRGVAKWKLERYEEAIADLTKVIKPIPEHVSSYMIMADCKVNLKRYEEAITYFSDVIRLDPNNSDAYFNRAYVKVVKGDSDGGIADFTTAKGLNPDLESPYQIVVATYLDLGYKKQEDGNYDGAIADFKKIIAIVDSTKIIEGLDQKYYAAAAYFNIGNALRLRGKGGDYETAIKNYNKALDLKPDFAAHVYRNRGLVNKALGKHDAAQHDFDKAKKLSPDLKN